jgi:hypothetical protein
MRAKIGAANSVNMREYMAAHPEIAKQRNEAMLAAHTPEVESNRIAAVRVAMANLPDVSRQRMSVNTKHRWVNGEMAGPRAKAAATFKRRAASGEIDFTQRNDRLSARISQMYVDGSFMWCRGHHESSKTGLKHRYRSRWELQYMQLLDADPDVIQWRSEPTVIPYELAGKQRRYVPDFIVQRVNSVELVEVKPQTLRETSMNAAKRAAAIALCASEGWTYREWAPT